MKASTIIGSILIILALTCGTTYMITSIIDEATKPSWLTNDVDELKANANTHYQETMKKYSPSIAEVEKDVERIMNQHPGNPVNVETNEYEYRKSGSNIIIETDAYEYRKSGSNIRIETKAYEYRKSGSNVNLEYY